MLELIAIGFVAGLVAGISPCILPVLPVILVAGAAPPEDGRPARGTWLRPVLVVAGLVLSFSLVILAGSEVLSLLHLPQDLLRDLGVAMLVVVGLGFLFPPLANLIERPFARIGTRAPGDGTAPFVLGLALGALFVPCAGPVLAAISVVGATHRVGLLAVALTLAFAAGSAVPLLAVAVAGSQLTRRVAAVRRRAPRIRQVSGVLLVGMALTFGFNTFSGLQRAVPGYTNALQQHVEGSSSVRKQLNSVTGNGATALSNCNPDATDLVNCGPAPDFAGITAWLNTPGDRPLTMAGLRGKVVLVDFWTYSCINCQRTLPHVEAWYQEYARYGLVVVGVHTPEFAFEHVVSNVRAESAALGVRYPVAIDDDDATWDAYDNEYWPADYLIDAAGDVRHVHFGEGDYSGTESLIRLLLADAHPGVQLPPATDVPDLTPSGDLSPETYVGYQNLEYLVPGEITENAPAVYAFPPSLPFPGLAFSGTWTDGPQEATAGANAEMELSFLATDVYLVIGGSGTVGVWVDGRHRETFTVSGVPKLYTLLRAPSETSGTLLLHASPGIEAYDFTFG